MTMIMTAKMMILPLVVSAAVDDDGFDKKLGNKPAINKFLVAFPPS